MHREETAEIQIRSLGHSGEGVGSFEGFTLFIEGALPGETVSFRLKEKKRRYGRGELLSSAIAPFVRSFQSVAAVN